MFSDLRRRYIAIDIINIPTLDNFHALVSNRNELVVKHLASYNYILCIATKTRYSNDLTYFTFCDVMTSACSLFMFCTNLNHLLY